MLNTLMNICNRNKYVSIYTDKSTKVGIWDIAQVANGLILHSDQGFQYTSKGYSKLTKEYGILPSMSRPGTPLDNACAENFFLTLKSECVNRQNFATYDEARLIISDYINFYNYHRIQLKTKLTPYEKRCQFA